MRSTVMPPAVLLALLTLFSAGCAREQPAPVIESGSWRATVTLPGGELPFHIELDTGTPPTAFIVNGRERVEVGEVRVDGPTLSLVFPAFNNRIDATLRDGELEGSLTLVKRGGKEQVMPLRAVRGVPYRFFPAGDAVGPDVDGRWAVTFTEDEGDVTAAVGEFTQDGALLEGTFMTPTGDYRYLAGQMHDGALYLSTFDGAHAFLFVARQDEEGNLAGDFWSGTAWHERWSARRDDAARLPDASELTFINEGYERFTFAFPDIAGNVVSLDDERFRGKVVLVTLAGSWCPNCHDEAAFMAPFFEAYRERGLEVVALMYEHFGDFETAAERTRMFREKFGIEYETLIAGISDKDEAAKTLPMLNHVLAFPTTIFVDRAGRVRKIHTGFTGPGTGEHYERLKSEFTTFVEQLLSDVETGEGHKQSSAVDFSEDES